MDAENATRAGSWPGAACAQSESGFRLPPATTAEHVTRRSKRPTSARSIRGRSARSRLSLPLCLCLITATTGQAPGDLRAQVRPDTNTTTDVDTSEDSELERRLRELTGGGSVPAIANPVVLSRMLVPGEGIQILPLGTPFAQVRLEFGPPVEEKTTGLLGKTLNWLYTADDGTNIILTGTETIEEISVRGPTNSTFMTREGLSFGTAAVDIPTFYGEPDNADPDESFDYPQQGIRFGIEAGRIDHIVLSAPVLD